MFERYRELWEQHRNDPGRHNAHVATPFLARTQHLVIADTEAEAQKVGLQAYATWAGHIHHLTRKLGHPDVHKTTPYDEDSAQRLIAGSPETVLEKLDEMLRLFWEGHDPTQGMRQGNDVGTQYRSAIYLTGPAQREAVERTRDAFAGRLAAAGYGEITTEIADAGPFYYAEDYHQQYLAKNPGGYCGLGGTGVSCPVGVARA